MDHGKGVPAEASTSRFAMGWGVGGAGWGWIKNQAANKQETLEREIPLGVHVWRRVGDRRYWRL